jgi:pSer/pThr/pTyr-binding forkhead associated (FHA) protein/tetratricopeptide (TPR) repeat protein
MKLQVFKKDKLIIEQDIDKKPLVLGRADTCDLVLDDTDIARQHVEFRKKSSKVVSFIKRTTFGKLYKNGEELTEGDLLEDENLNVGNITIKILPEDDDNFIGQEMEDVPLVDIEGSVDDENKKDENKEDENKEEEGKEDENKKDEDQDEIKADEKIEEKVKKKDDFELFTMSADSVDLENLAPKETNGSAKDRTGNGKADKDEPDKKAVGRDAPDKDELDESKNKDDGDSKTSTRSNTKTEKGKSPVNQIHAGKDQKDNADATMIGGAFVLYKLTAISGPYKDRQFNLEKQSIMIGRKKDADIVLVEESVSREHAKLSKQGVDYYLTDLNSANGTKVNGKSLSEPTLLVSGDIIELGSSVLRFMVLNPQAQDAKGIDIEAEKYGKKSVVEKVAPSLSQADINKIEKSYGSKKEVDPKKKKMMQVVIAFAIILIVVMFLLPSSPKQEPPKTEPEITGTPPVEEEAIPELQCTEIGSFCQQPPGLQKQLMAEYEVGVKLFKNFQFELAEDRAQQILSKVPDWPKAIELLEISGFEKEKLLSKKKEEEEAQIRKLLEEKLANYLKEAEDHFRKKDYDKTKESLSNVFELDPNNKRAKEIVDQIEEVMAQRARALQKRSEYRALVSKYTSTLNDGKRYLARKEYMKAIETFQRCLTFMRSDSAEVSKIRNECSTMADDANRLLRELITPELTVAEELFSTGQFREAIASYKRVLNMDYKNKTAKLRITEAQKAITEDAKENYARAAIAESVSDMSNACLLYYKVLQIAIPGSRYYDMALDKTKKLCTKDRGSGRN